MIPEAEREASEGVVQGAAAVRAAGAQHVSSVHVSYVCMCRKRNTGPCHCWINSPPHQKTRSVRGVSTATVSQTGGIPVSDPLRIQPKNLIICFISF
jgi:hypothetical protein